MKTYSIEVKPKLKKILKERGITQTEFSTISGLTQSTISRFDSNTQHLDRHLIIIALSLNLQVEDLFEVINL